MIGLRMLRAICICALVAVPAEADAARVVPPCAGASVPAYAAPGEAPKIMTLRNTELDADWPPPLCAYLPASRPALLVALAGRFSGAQDRDALLMRWGAISTHTRIRYWSVTDHRWERLVIRAEALAGARTDMARADFAADEMVSGRDLYFAQEDNRSSAPVIYRMRLHDVTAHGFVVETENVSAVRYLLMTIYRPGDLRSVVFLEQDSQGDWDYYALTAIAAEPRLFGASERSYINRAVALFRHIAGIPTDLEPPAAR